MSDGYTTTTTIPPSKNNMAAMVERPMSVLNDMSTPGPSMEIIDVDAFEDEGLNLISDLEESSSLTTFNSPPVMRSLDRGSRRSTPQTIYLLDSDDEDVSGCITNPGESSNRRRMLSPPPRNVPVSTIPPVPPVPPRFAGHTSFPMRFQPPPFPSPSVIRPISSPLSFENALDAPIAGPSNHRLRRRNDTSAPQAAPPSHHVPSMGLGGAIISSHRSGNSTSEPQRAPPVTFGERFRLPSFTSGLVEYSRWALRRTVNPFFADDSEIDDLFGDDGGEDLFPVWQDVNFRPRQSVHEKDQYLSSYTHPYKPEPGFTFDFALPTANTRTGLFPPTSINNPIVLDDDDDSSNESSTALAGPSSSSSTSDTGQVTATLVCANCSDLLLLNAALHPSQSDRRVWGLRCGHIIDEKCLNQLGQPRQVVEDMPDHAKGKGKAKATDFSGHSYGDTTVSENQTVLEAVQENSIRSRLRSRPNSRTLNAPLVDSSPPPNRLACKRRRISNKKKKVEAEYAWMCPVPNCCRVHVSVKVDGVWGPEKERGFAGGKIMNQPQSRGVIPIFA